MSPFKYTMQINNYKYNTCVYICVYVCVCVDVEGNGKKEAEDRLNFQVQFL